jgi:type III secretory pathway lipoprotein EscJ
MKYLLLALLALLLTSCRQVELLHDLPEHDANRLLSALIKASISAEKERQDNELWSITVEKSTLSQALDLITAPTFIKSLKDRERTLPQGILPSRAQESMTLLTHRAQEIERLLETIPLVAEARVTLSPKGTASLDSASLTSSVVLLVEKDFNQSKDEIAQIVAGASGCAPTDVSLLLSLIQGEEAPK